MSGERNVCPGSPTGDTLFTDGGQIEEGDADPLGVSIGPIRISVDLLSGATMSKEISGVRYVFADPEYPHAVNADVDQAKKTCGGRGDNRGGFRIQFNWITWDNYCRHDWR